MRSRTQICRSDGRRKIIGRHSGVEGKASRAEKRIDLRGDSRSSNKDVHP